MGVVGWEEVFVLVLVFVGRGGGGGGCCEGFQVVFAAEGEVVFVIVEWEVGPGWRDPVDEAREERLEVEDWSVGWRWWGDG